MRVTASSSSSSLCGPSRCSGPSSRRSTALGSADESRSTLRAAIAWGHIGREEIAEGDQLLDRVSAMLYKLGARRQ